MSENEDYEPVDEVLQLTANNRECIGAIIEEDLKSEGNEEFDMVLLDNTGSECNRVTITLLDEEGIVIVYCSDSVKYFSMHVR